jgi:adenylate kinase
MASDGKKAPIIFVLGGPGSGKGTQCEKLRDKYGFVHLSTGDLLREEVSGGSDLGKQLENIMKEGKLVPLDTVMTLLKNAMEKHPEAKGFLIDGYPREVEQAKEFEKKIRPADVILYFEVSDEIMTQRLLGRALTSGRADDNEETIKKRLVTFHDQTKPVIDAYPTKVKKIDCSGQIDGIFAEVCKCVDPIVQ